MSTKTTNALDPQEETLMRAQTRSRLESRTGSERVRMTPPFAETF